MFSLLCALNSSPQTGHATNMHAPIGAFAHSPGNPMLSMQLWFPSGWQPSRPRWAARCLLRNVSNILWLAWRVHPLTTQGRNAER